MDGGARRGFDQFGVAGGVSRETSPGFAESCAQSYYVSVVASIETVDFWGHVAFIFFTILDMDL